VKLLSSWGNAGNWAEGARKSGYLVSDTPAVGTIAVNTSSGHVAWVTEINKDENTVTVSEMNCFVILKGCGTCSNPNDSNESVRIKKYQATWFDAGYIYHPGVDVVLVIDRSGSMDDYFLGYYEPRITGAKDASKLFVDLMTENDKVGVVSFADTASLNFPLTPITPEGQVVFSDNMESETGNWTAQSPWTQITTDYHSYTKCWTDSPDGNYSNNTNVSLMSLSLDLSGLTNPVLSFWTRYSFENGYDYGNVYVSFLEDSSWSSWEQVASYTGTQSSWVKKQVPLNSYKGKVIKIAFQVSSDWLITDDGWYIDDVEIKDASTKDLAKSEIDSILASGATSIGAGLSLGQQQLTTRGAGDPIWSMVLLSDGQENTSPMVKDVLPDIMKTKTRIYTIGLGSDADQSLLNTIALVTGGSYHFSYSGEELTKIYQDIQSAVSGLHGIDSINTNIAQGETKRFSIPIDSSIHSVLFTATVTGSDIDLVLIKPDGTLIDPSVAATDPNINFISGANYKSYTVLSPMPGTWQMRVTGIDIATGGEMITVSVSASTDLTLTLDFDKIEYISNEPITVFAELKDSLGPILGASVVAEVENPSGSLDTLTLFDDGLHGDGASGDEIYANQYGNTSQRGSYTFKVDASGTSNTGESFTRTATKSTVVGRDSDNDGMPDVWEDIFGLDKYADDSGEDPDNDGLTNLQEYLHRTNPKNPDTDGDSYNDGEEVAKGSNPRDPNSIPSNIMDIAITSPANDIVFNSCSLIINYQPTFSWTANGTFKKFTILFSTSPTDFTAPIARKSIPGASNSWTPPIGLWKKIMKLSYNNGGIRDIYWKVIGKRSDRTTAESEVRSFHICPSGAVTINSPSEGELISSNVPPTFNFNSNCNVKFRLEFSPVSDFSDPTKIKGFVFTTNDPNVETVIQKTLTPGQWRAVKKLVGRGTGYFRIKTWDGIKRETVSEVRSFSIQY
jgi:surface antigen